MIETEHIEALRDTVASVIPLIRELVENSSPEPYTVENLWWTKLNVAISVAAALIGGAGAYYGYKGFVYAKKTARNVARLPQETQVKLCVSLLQDLLLNYVRGIVISCNHKHHGLKPPSDNYISNFMLPEFEDIFNPESFNQNWKAYICLNDIKLRMKHYNHMVEVIESHCFNDRITDKDCKDLVIKTSKVIRSVFNFIKEIDGTQEKLKHTLIEKIALQTNGRTEKVELNDENKQIFRTIVDAMKIHPGMVKFDDVPLDLSSAVSKTIQCLMDREGAITTTEMFAYNGLIERQYME